MCLFESMWMKRCDAKVNINIFRSVGQLCYTTSYLPFIDSQDIYLYINVRVFTDPVYSLCLSFDACAYIYFSRVKMLVGILHCFVSRRDKSFSHRNISLGWSIPTIPYVHTVLYIVNAMNMRFIQHLSNQSLNNLYIEYYTHTNIQQRQ